MTITLCFCLQSSRLAGKVPEDVRSNICGRLRCHTQPLLVISGNCAVFSACLKAALVWTCAKLSWKADVGGLTDVDVCWTGGI